MQITDIRCENEAGTQLAATVNGTRWSGITQASRFWKHVQAAIASGAGVEAWSGPTNQAADVRAERDRLLRACDHFGLVDVRADLAPEAVAAWDAYRQALRDVPEQAGFPDEVEWPEEPA